MNLHILYRSTPNETATDRPAFFSKRVALQSLVGAIDESVTSFEEVTWSFLCDGGVPLSCASAMGNLGTISVLAPKRGNGGSYQLTIAEVVSAAWALDDIVYMAEDDYLYTVDAFTNLVSLFQNLRPPYVTLYDHPDYERFKSQRRYTARFCPVVIGNCRWRPVLSTCMTYATTVGQLRLDAWIHLLASRTLVPCDEVMWHAIVGGRKARLAALFCEQEAVADRYLCLHAVRRSAKDAVFRALNNLGPVISCVSPERLDRLRSAHRGPKLWAPSPTLSTHMMNRHLAPGQAWDRIAAEADGRGGE